MTFEWCGLHRVFGKIAKKFSAEIWKKCLTEVTKIMFGEFSGENFLTKCTKNYFQNILQINFGQIIIDFSQALHSISQRSSKGFQAVSHPT